MQTLTYRTVSIFMMFLLFIGVGACNRHDIELDVVHRTSDRLECDRVFAGSAKAITELNEIWIQTGTISIVPSCIIWVGGKEVVMKLKRSLTRQGETKETYHGQGYDVKLVYHAERSGTSTIYKGRCQIRLGVKYTDLKIEGLRSRL
jgi:hypothetical protein